MSFKIFTNMISLASRRMAGGILFSGLVLAAFGVLLIEFPKFFAYIAAGFFFIAAGLLIVTSLKIYIAGWRFKRTIDSFSNPPSDGRENVRVSFGQKTDFIDEDNGSVR